MRQVTSDAPATATPSLLIVSTDEAKAWHALHAAIDRLRAFGHSDAFIRAALFSD